MNKFYTLFLICCLASCEKSPNEIKKNEIAENQNEIKNEVVNPIEKGKTLVEGTDCLTCHQIKTTSIGPSFEQIADKYENSQKTIDMLSDKIINGSVGVWGDVPMMSRPRLSQENAAFMAQYIMSFKEN